MNVADVPAACDFYLPAVARDGEVVVAVGTGGAAPALARQLARQLAEALPERVGEFAAWLSCLREELQAGEPDAARRRDILRRLAGAEGQRRFAAGGDDALRGLLAEMLQER